MLEGLVEEILNIMQKEYLYKRNSKGGLITRTNRLVDPDHGSAIKSFRDQEEAKSKLPKLFWT